MKLTAYHYEILNILDEKYPKLLRKNTLLALLSNKNPDDFDREIAYLKEHKLIEEKKVELELQSIIWSFPFTIAIGLKITANGIDALKTTKGEESVYIAKRKKVLQPVAFISASFDDGANQLIKWIRNRAENVGFNTLWQKEIYRIKPTVDKIDEAINDSDCIIQVLTSHVFDKDGEAGWIGNEMGMAFKSRPGKNVAVFVQKGYHVSGLPNLLTDVFPLDPENLPQDEKKAEEYLKDLKKRIRILDEK